MSCSVPRQVFRGTSQKCIWKFVIVEEFGSTFKTSNISEVEWIMSFSRAPRISSFIVGIPRCWHGKDAAQVVQTLCCRGESKYSCQRLFLDWLSWRPPSLFTHRRLHLHRQQKEKSMTLMAWKKQYINKNNLLSRRFRPSHLPLSLYSIFCSHNLAESPPAPS